MLLSNEYFQYSSP